MKMLCKFSKNLIIPFFTRKALIDSFFLGGSPYNHCPEIHLYKSTAVNSGSGPHSCLSPPGIQKLGKEVPKSPEGCDLEARSE